MAKDSEKPPYNSMQETDESRKRKRPPTFQYLPDKRAKKLKKEWIEKQKIKAKWRAQKRREGLNPAQVGTINSENGQEGDGETNGANEDVEHPLKAASAEISDNQTSHVPRRNSSSSLPPSKQSQLHRQHQERQLESDEINLRELRKKAYSRSSLHTYKSDPLKRRKSNFTGDSGPPKGPKGQPNMKLRMEAMLEQIKRGTK